MCIRDSALVEDNIKNYKGTIVISALNIRAGGPLSILKECLHGISKSTLINEYKVIALVNSKENCYYNNITYYVFPKAVNRLYYYYLEYFGLKRFSQNIDALLWLSLSDKTPTVRADKRAVYIHNPTPFFKIKLPSINSLI